jgi:hypothetical protein
MVFLNKYTGVCAWPFKLDQYRRCQMIEPFFYTCILYIYGDNQFELLLVAYACDYYFLLFLLLLF